MLFEKKPGLKSDILGCGSFRAAEVLMYCIADNKIFILTAYDQRRKIWYGPGGKVETLKDKLSRLEYKREQFGDTGDRKHEMSLVCKYGDLFTDIDNNIEDTACREFYEETNGFPQLKIPKIYEDVKSNKSNSIQFVRSRLNKDMIVVNNESRFAIYLVQVSKDYMLPTYTFGDYEILPFSQSNLYKRRFFWIEIERWYLFIAEERVNPRWTLDIADKIQEKIYGKIVLQFHSSIVINTLTNTQHFSRRNRDKHSNILCTKKSASL